MTKAEQKTIIHMFIATCFMIIGATGFGVLTIYDLFDKDFFLSGKIGMFCFETWLVVQTFLAVRQDIKFIENIKTEEKE